MYTKTKGLLSHFQTDPLSFFDDIAKIASVFPDKTHFDLTLGLVDVSIVLKPEFAQKIVMSDCFSKGITQGKLRPILGNGLLTANNEDWHKARSILKNAFTAEAISGHGKVLGEIARRRCDINTSINLHQFASETSIEFASRLFLSGDINQDKISDIKTSVDALQTEIAKIMWQPLNVPEWIPTKTNRVIREHKKILGALINDEIINIKTHITQYSERHPLKLLIEAGMSDKELFDHAMTFLIAGYETTGSSIAWALNYLPKYQNMIQEERIQNNVDENHNYFSMKQTTAFMNEILRIRPSAWFFARQATKDFEGIKKGRIVFISPWMFHRNPIDWPNPEEIILDRSNQRQKFSFLPFGLGSRACIGAKVAQMELLSVLAAFDKKFTIEGEAKPIPGVTLSISQDCVLVPENKQQVIYDPQSHISSHI